MSISAVYFITLSLAIVTCSAVESPKRPNQQEFVTISQWYDFFYSAFCFRTSWITPMKLINNIRKMIDIEDTKIKYLRAREPREKMIIAQHQHLSRRFVHARSLLYKPFSLAKNVIRVGLKDNGCLIEDLERLKSLRNTLDPDSFVHNYLLPEMVNEQARVCIDRYWTHVSHLLQLISKDDAMMLDKITKLVKRVYNVSGEILKKKREEFNEILGYKVMEYIVSLDHPDWNKPLDWTLNPDSIVIEKIFLNEVGYGGSKICSLMHPTMSSYAIFRKHSQGMIDPASDQFRITIKALDELYVRTKYACTLGTRHMLDHINSKIQDFIIKWLGATQVTN